VNTTGGCSWNLQSSAPWARVISTQNESNGTLIVATDVNTGGPRSATISIGNQTVTVSQTGTVGNLAAPDILAPAPDQTLDVQGITFRWTPVSGADGYSMRIYGANGAGVPSFVGTTGGQTSSSTLVSLPFENEYDFFVRSCAGGFTDLHCGSYRSVRFKIVLEAPSRSPTVLFPPEGSTLTTSTHEIKWTAVPGATSYRVELTTIPFDFSVRRELRINVTGTSTIFSMRSTGYSMRVWPCNTKCGTGSRLVLFSVNLPPVPTVAPVVSSAAVFGGNQLEIKWQPVTNADLYVVQAVQPPPAGPGGGALTVASGRTSAHLLTMPVPTGAADVIVAACNGNGCGPYSLPYRIFPPGPNPAAPILATPIPGSTIQGPTVLFSWNRIPGDDGSNTTYRLFALDFSRQATALDVLTKDRFYGAYFQAEGTRYDALVIANRGLTQVQGPPAGFLVQGNSASAPTMMMPQHEGTVKAGMVQLGWTPLPIAGLYEYFVAVRGQSNATARGVTTGLVVQVPLQAMNGQPTGYSGIVRACTPGATCAFGSDANWGPWSNIAGPGVTNFTVVP
jgi:hypothetical protein